MNKSFAALLGVGFTVIFGGAAVQAQELEKLTLAGTVSLALQNSSDVALARAKAEIAKNHARVLKSEFQPNLYTGSAVGYTNGFPETFNNQPPSPLQIGYSQEIFDGPLRGQVRADEERAKNDEVELSRLQNAIIVRTAVSYLELGKAHHTVDLLRKERVSADKIIELTKERASKGMALPVEITQAELNLAKIDQRIAQLAGREQVLTKQLQIWTGVPAEKFDGVTAEDLPRIQPSSEDPIHAALESSFSLKEAENEHTARTYLLQGERLGRWPSVALVGQYDLLAKFNNYDQFYKTFQRNNVSVGLLVRIPIFSSKTSAGVAFARSQLSEANLSLKNLRDNEEIAAQQTINKLPEQDAALNVAKLELKLTQENLALAQSRFDQGQALLKDLEQAHLDEDEKWMAFLDAAFARQQAQLALMEITGQLSKVFK